MPSSGLKDSGTIPIRKATVEKSVEKGAKASKRDIGDLMMAANKLYRKEDIQALKNKVVNPGWGPGGANTYDIWLYKGGGSCRHRWLRQTFKIKGKRGSIYGPNSEQISTNEARRQGFNPRNEREVSMKPKDMPNQGFLNK